MTTDQTGRPPPQLTRVLPRRSWRFRTAAKAKVTSCRRGSTANGIRCIRCGENTDNGNDNSFADERDKTAPSANQRRDSDFFVIVFLIIDTMANELRVQHFESQLVARRTSIWGVSSSLGWCAIIYRTRIGSLVAYWRAVLRCYGVEKPNRSKRHLLVLRVKW